jgi:son of sevenless-like protein
LAGKYVKNIHHVEITTEDIMIAMCADKVLMDLFDQDGVVGGSVGISEERSLDLASTYDEVVKDLIAREKQYRRELHMIIKVFREQMMSVHPVRSELDIIFGNILDIEEVTLNLLSSLEDSVEMTEENRNLAVGSCFLEFAEVEEFAVYEVYAKGVLSPEAREMLNDLLSKSEVCRALQSAGHGFKEAVKYVLPKLLLSPIYHCLEYLDYVRLLLRLSESEDDRESLEEASSLLKPLETELERVVSASNLPPKGVKKFGDHVLYYSHRRTSRQDTLKKLNELQKAIDGWESKDNGQSCNEFIFGNEIFSVLHV